MRSSDKKPMFREAFKRRRCIMPASGFYERSGEKGEKVPHLFSAADGSPVLGFAGLWDKWYDAVAGEDVLSATIVVSGASEWMQPYHDRMPMLLTPELFDAGLMGTTGMEVLRPAAEAALREWIVTTRLNWTGQGNDDPTMVDQAA